MNKNIVIAFLIIVITILVGAIVISNFSFFSEGWFVGLGMILGGVGTAAILTYLKIVR